MDTSGPIQKIYKNLMNRLSLFLIFFVGIVLIIFNILNFAQNNLKNNLFKTMISKVLI